MLFHIVRELAARTDGVLVAVSRGKDSLALLEVACRHFRHVEAFCMHLVPRLSFVERHLAYLERRYGVSIDRVPHWWLSQAYRRGAFRALAADCPAVTIRDIQAAQKARAGLAWILSGEKKCDSLQRRGMLTANGGIDEQAGVAYPLADWTDRQVYTYLRQQQIALPSDYSLLGRSFSCQLDGRTLSLIQTHFPDDYAKIEEAFPFCGAAVARHRLAAAASLAEGPGAGGPAS